MRDYFFGGFPGTEVIQLLYIEKEENREMEICLSDLFNIAVDRDYRVYGKLIDEGVCIDFGNINTFVKYKVLVENKGVSAKGRILWNE